jgi:chitodextrinase
MPDVFGPFDTATWGQGPWFRDAWARSSGGVQGLTFGTPSSGDLGLTVSGLTVTMGLGRANVRGAGYERTGTAWSYTVPANTSTNPRIDRLVLRRDLAARTVVPLVLQGTPAASPVAPALQQVEDGVWDLPLFAFTVPPNSGAPVTGIVDQRGAGAPPRHWGVATRFPRPEDGVRVGDRFINSLYTTSNSTQNGYHGGGTEFVWTGYSWRQAHATTVENASDRTALTAALIAAGAASWPHPEMGWPFHDGFELMETAGNRRYYWHGSVWLLLADPNHSSRYNVEQLTAATGWSITSVYIKQAPNGAVYLVGLAVTRTGAAITVPASGDVGNAILCTLNARWWPAQQVPMTADSTGPLASAALGSDGQVTLFAVAPGTSLATGSQLSLAAGYYPVADPVALLDYSLYN